MISSRAKRVAEERRKHAASRGGARRDAMHRVNSHRTRARRAVYIFASSLLGMLVISLSPITPPTRDSGFMLRSARI